MEKLTAVEFLADNLHYLHSTKWEDILIKAKEMEKQLIIDAYWGGLNGAINDYSDNKIKFGGGAEQYYNETFNK